MRLHWLLLTGDATPPSDAATASPVATPVATKAAAATVFTAT